MERFPAFWRGWRAKYVDEVEIRLIREQSSQLLALMKGDVHMIQANLTADELEKLEASPHYGHPPGIDANVGHPYAQSAPPLTDVNVRKAFSHAFNYDSFIKDILKLTFRTLFRNSEAILPASLQEEETELAVDAFIAHTPLFLYAPPLNHNFLQIGRPISDPLG